MDYESGHDVGPLNFEFTEESVRKAFIRKVYGILTLQLLVTFGIVAIFTYVQSVKEYVYDHPAFFWASFGLSLAVMVVLICAGDLRRKTPLNFIFLFIFTICEGLLLGSLCAMLDSWEVSIAVVATLVVVISLTLFAFQTRFDFTMMAGALLSLTMCLITFGIFALIFQNSVMTLLYSCFGALLFSLYLVFDTQLILGGKHKLAVSPEEYVFAALNLYLDVINLFLMILAIISGTRN